MSSQAYDELTRRFRDYSILNSCASLLGWDERTQLPPHGAEHRSEQMALLARMAHEMLTAPALADALAAATSDTANEPADSDRAVTVREIQRIHDRAVKIPQRLVEELARSVTRAQQVWQDARANDDFASFQPWLDRIVALKREEAAAVGFEDVPYDALLDEYEPGAKSRDLSAVFAELRAALVPLLERIQDSGRRPRTEILEREYDPDRQAELGKTAARLIGFDFDAGRLDVTAHPFCSSIGPGDCRITTRYNPRRFGDGFFGILHEAGHGIYEQGLDPAQFGLPLGSPTSLGIHESQSRLWENQIGRSWPFWDYFFPLVRNHYPASLGTVNQSEFYFAINDVQPSFIRVEADEVTYNLHIILRFELEQAIVAGDLPAAEVPSAWNEKFKDFFNLEPKTFALGCLQDIHWSMGGIGYFPTYTLGNLYAAQFMEQARLDLPDLDDDVRRGEFGGLKNWLRDRIHSPGMRYRSAELCERVTGKKLSPRPFLFYLSNKFGELYGI